MKPITAKQLFGTWVLHGDSGVGKTTLSATAPKPGFLNSNEGTLSIADRPGLEHVRARPVRGMKDLDAAYDNAIGTGKRDWRKRFSSLVFDNFDDIQGIVLDELVERAVERDSEREPDAIEQREWGIMAGKLQRYLRKFRRVPMHKILVCSSKEDFETGQQRPNLQGQLKERLNYFADHVAYLRMGKKGIRYLHLDAGEDFFAKTRAWWLPPEARKIKIDFNDTAQLTKLFALIAAGPQPGQRKPKRSTDE